jgi:Family of unknown function (DUF5413)
MKRYAIFGASGPLIGGFLLLLTTTLTSGYWSHSPSLLEAERLLTLFARTLQYSYLFGLIPSLMLGAVDDILFHIKRIAPAIRPLIVGVAGFAASELLYGSRGADNGTMQFVLYGLVGFVPGMALSWLSHHLLDRPA